MDFGTTIIEAVACGIAGSLTTIIIQKLQKHKRLKLLPIEKEILVRAHQNEGDICVRMLGNSHYGMIIINNWRPFDQNNESIQANAINGLKHLVDLSLIIDQGNNNFELTFKGNEFAKKLKAKGFKI